MILNIKSKYKKSLTPALFIIAIFALTSCAPTGEVMQEEGTVQPRGEQTPQEQESLTEEASLLNISETDKAYYNSAITLGDMSSCDRISDSAYREDCKSFFLSATASEEIVMENCATIENPDEREACEILNETRKKEIEKMTSREVPEMSEEEKHQEQMDAILRSGDETKCTELPTAELTSRCRAVILTDKAVKQQDITVCDQLSGEDAGSCRDNYNEAYPQ